MATGMFGPSIYDTRAQINQEYNQAFDNSRGIVDDVGLLYRQGFNMAAEALGGGDPRMVKAKKMEAIKQRVNSQVDLEKDPVAFYKAFGAALKAEGMVEEAANVLMAAEKMEDQRLDREVKKEELEERAQKNKWAHEDRMAVLAEKAKTNPQAKLLFDYMNGPFKDAPNDRKALAFEIFERSGDMNNAIRALGIDKEGKDTRSPSFEGDGRRWILDPATYASNPAIRNPNIPGYVDGGATRDPDKVSVTVPISLTDKAMGVRKDFDTTIKPYKERVEVINPLLNKLQLALTNPAAAASIRQGFAASTKADAQISKKEIEALTNMGGITTRIAGSINAWLNGTMTLKQAQDIVEVLQQDKAEALGRIGNEVKAVQPLLRDIDPGVREYITNTLPNLSGDPTSSTTKSGIKYRIIE